MREVWIGVALGFGFLALIYLNDIADSLKVLAGR